MKRSRLELQVAEILHELRFPAWHEEYLFALPERRWRFDFCWPERHYALEVDGASFGGRRCPACKRAPGGRHTSPTGFSNDCEKMSFAALRGWRVVRVTDQMLRDKDGRALELLEWLRYELTKEEDEIQEVPNAH